MCVPPVRTLLLLQLTAPFLVQVNWTQFVPLETEKSKRRSKQAKERKPLSDSAFADQLGINHHAKNWEEEDSSVPLAIPPSAPFPLLDLDLCLVFR